MERFECFVHAIVLTSKFRKTYDTIKINKNLEGCSSEKFVSYVSFYFFIFRMSKKRGG